MPPTSASSSVKVPTATTSAHGTSLPPPAPANLPGPTPDCITPEDVESGVEAGVIDMEVFGQLLEMDDDGQHNFSKPLAQEYIEQADETLQEIDKYLLDTSKSDQEQLEFLSGRGHFLKGSSAALGLLKVRDSCETLQNLGKCKDGSKDIPPKRALELCRELLPKLKLEQVEATAWLKGLCAIEDG